MFTRHQGLEGRSNNPVALLYDTLNHPDADTGQDLPSLLTWKHHPEHAIDHVVLGRGPVGGSWQVIVAKKKLWLSIPFGYLNLNLNGENKQVDSLRIRRHYISASLDRYFLPYLRTEMPLIGVACQCRHVCLKERYSNKVATVKGFKTDRSKK